MKNIILQHWKGPKNELVLKSFESMKGYAESIGAEHLVIEGDAVHPQLAPQSQKMVIIDERFDEYDYVVMVDSDMFIRKGQTQNIFTDVTGYGRHHGIQTTLRRNLCARFPDLGNVNAPYWGGSVYRLDLDIRKTFRKHFNLQEAIRFNTTFHDEGIMHRLAVLSGMEEKEDTYLPGQQWNYSSFDEGVENAEFIHIRTKVRPGGPKREKIENYRSLVERGIIA